MDALPGRLLNGRYRIERRLGEGGAGVVWLVADTRARGHTWALKELDFDGIVSAADRAEAIALFEREAQMLSGLSHPALPRVVDRFSDGDRRFLVMERVEGPTLDEILGHRGAPVTEAEAVDWGVQICDVLDYLHALTPPVVYRDLKPSNVMVSVEGRVRLVDFGIARSLHPHRPGDTVAYGTPGYAPPEQYAGHAVAASDLYALGVTLLRLLTRCDPQAPGFTLLSARAKDGAVSCAMDALIADCTRFEAGARPSASQVRARLAALQQTKARRGDLWTTLARLLRRR